MADSLRDLGELVLDRTLVLNLLCGLSRHYYYLKALIKRSMPFPSFHDVRNELLLEELTMDTESPTSATMLYNASFTSHAHSHFDDRGEGAARPPAAPTAPGGLRQAPSFDSGRWSRKGVHGAVALPMVAPSVEAVVPRSRLSTTPCPGPSPCDRARHEYFLVTLPQSTLLTTPSYGAPPASAPTLPYPSSAPPLLPASRDPRLGHLVPVGWRLGPGIPRRLVQHHG